MTKIRNFTEEETPKNLEEIRKQLKKLKDQLAEALAEYEDKDEARADRLTEALDALEDAFGSCGRCDPWRINLWKKERNL